MPIAPVVVTSTGAADVDLYGDLLEAPICRPEETGVGETTAAAFRVSFGWTTKRVDVEDDESSTAVAVTDPHGDVFELQVRWPEKTGIGEAIPAPSSVSAGATIKPPDVRDNGAAFLASLWGALESEPIEDGCKHIAEDVIIEALDNFGPGTVEGWIRRVWNERRGEEPAACAGLLRCLARVPRDRVFSFGLAMAKDALRHEDVEVREAGVRALEAWDALEGLEDLKRASSVERVPWLRDYMNALASDLLAQ
jgi:hypothetical protein